MQTTTRYLRIKEAAALLGVCDNTLRNWGRLGKIPEHRHPVNNYRLYKRQDLEQVLQDLEQSTTQRPGRKAK